MNKFPPSAHSVPLPQPSQEEVTAFCQAANNNNEQEIIAGLAKYGKNIIDELCQGAGDTPLAWAAWAGHENIVTILLEAGADIDKKCRNGSTALIWAVQRQQRETTLQLLEAGADTEIANSNGQTALMAAEQSNYHEIAEILKRETRAERQRREEEERRAEERRQNEIRIAREAAEARFENLKKTRPQNPLIKKQRAPKP